MKKILTFLMCFLALNVTAQLFERTTPQDFISILRTHEIYNVNKDFAEFITNEQPKELKLKIPYKNEILEVDLTRNDGLFTHDFKIETTSGTINPNGVHYVGKLSNTNKSIATLSVFENHDAVFMASSQDLVNFTITAYKNQFIGFEDSELLIKNDFLCLNNESTPQPMTTTTQQSDCVKLYLEVDNDIFLNKGNFENTSNWVLGLYNNLHALFQADNINTKLSGVFIWDVQDPYTTTTNASMALHRFKNNRQVFNGDVAQLIGVDSGNRGGVAIGVNTMCSTNNYAYSDINYSYNTVPTYSWTIQVVIHEFGHLLGSPHTHACSWNGNNTAIDNCGSVAIPSGEGSSCKTTPSTLPSSTQKGSIMSYCHLVSGIGINFNNGFGEQPRNRIIQAINSATCTIYDCNKSCINGIHNVNYTATNTSVVVTWDDVASASSYKYQYGIRGGTYSGWFTTNSRTATISGLQSNQTYEVRIKPNCPDNADTFYRNYLISTNIDWCNGTYYIYDSGGANISYSANENYRRVITVPQNKKIKLQFMEFNVDATDKLYIYENNVLVKTLSGTSLPEDITTTSNTLTLHFVSDIALQKSGYKIKVICMDNTSIVVNDTMTSIYYTMCNNQFNSMVQPIVAYTRPQFKAYRFKIVDNMTGVTKILQKQAGLFYLSEIPAKYNHTYTVSVEVMTNYVWQGVYGPECLILAPKLPSGQESFTIYPNMTKDVFNIYSKIYSNIEKVEDVEIIIHDMLGRLILSEKIRSNELPFKQLGKELSAGVYTITIKQGDILEIKNVIKN